MRMDAVNGREVRVAESFDEVAELYDRVRPSYPEALIEDLARLAVLGPSSGVLEIGPGTGQLTVPLAKRGCSILAVEMGEQLASVARRKLAGFPSVQVVTRAFEDWPVPAEPFDAVVAATAFHWLDSELRVPKAAQALRDGGSLAIVSTHHVAGDDSSFFEQSQTCYERWDPATTPGFTFPAASEVPTGAQEIEAGGLFAPPRVRRYEEEAEYTTTSYLHLLQTYSGHRALPPDALRALLECLGDLIDKHHGGRIRKRYLWQLLVATRVDRR
jgi:SAM-dependent methyltransferase